MDWLKANLTKTIERVGRLASLSTQLTLLGRRIDHLVLKMHKAYDKNSKYKYTSGILTSSKAW